MVKPGEPLLVVELYATEFPGIRFEEPNGKVYEPVYVGVQRGEDVIDRIPGNTDRAVFHAEFRVAHNADGNMNFLGPYAKGKPRERFFYLAWGVEQPNGHFAGFRRAKIPLWGLTKDQVETALAAGTPLRGDVKLTDKKGGPACATLKSDLFRWRV